MKVLITGCNGQLGQCLRARMDDDSLQAILADRNILDITDPKAVVAFFHKHQPDFVINTAAYTEVDQAETDVETAESVNIAGPANLAHECSKFDIPLLHVSTDYVFDGRGDTPYQTDSPTSPQCVYGMTKFAGELAVMSGTNKHIIIRTSWLFSEFGSNFVKSILRLTTERETIGIVADQYGCPTYAGDLASAILSVVREVENHPDWSKYGLYHFCGEESTNWHGFASMIVDEALKHGLIEKQVDVLPISTEDYPTPVKRPAYSVLDCYGFPVKGINRCWQNSLETVLKKLAKSQFKIN